MPNELAKETSPYLLQHADNLVDWFPWNDDSLRLAREQNKPILLSVGYSACHWCHVMAHESFEDPPTAELMNDLFVNIKVDREERPDIDKIYQAAHQLAARAPGGWPLTVFLTPDAHLPIFTGTYFPREMFHQVLSRVEGYFRSHPDEVRTQGQALRNALQSLEHSDEPGDGVLSRAPLSLARERLEGSFDSDYGGFGDAPKFPHPTHIESLLDAWRRQARGQEPDLQALFMATLTLTRMAEAGLYDQLGGGFFRYSVDRYWAIPHFEKMLYDNAALVSVYSDAHAATGEKLFGRVASETADWVIRDMQDPDGGYYSTLDADSEGEEGKFYLWTPAELEAALDEEEAAVSSEHFGLTGTPNFEGRAWHLQVKNPLDALSQPITAEQARLRLDTARAKLLAVREQRIAPGRDEKILVAWNGLMVKGMANAARRLDRPDLASSAARAVDFIRGRLWHQGRLLASYKDGRARFPAYLDDYAFLADGLIELLQSRWRSNDLTFACELADILLGQFEDPNGGFFFTSHDHEALIHRPKPFADEATPSGNGVAARTLLWLGHLTGEQHYGQATQRTLSAAWPLLERYPEAHDTLVQALGLVMDPPELIVIRGENPTVLAQWQRYANAGFNPKRMTFAIPSSETDLPGFLQERTPRGEIVAYICEGTQCRAPIMNLEEFAAALG